MLQNLFKKAKKSDTVAAELSNLFSKELVINAPAPEPITEEVEVVVKLTSKQIEEKLQDRKERTIFVGNVAIATKKNQIMKMFETYGKIEKIWLRSVPVDRQGSKLPIKAAVITKKFKEGAESMNAYILFVEQSVQYNTILLLIGKSVYRSLSANGAILNDLHIRVDSEGQKKVFDCYYSMNQKDQTNTIFIGNVPFAAEEEALRKACEDSFGPVISVRLIKDRVTRQGKGFGYVKFAEFVSFQKAVKAASFKFEGREVRVQKSHVVKSAIIEDNSKNAFKRISKRVDLVVKEENKQLVKQQIRKKIKKVQKKGQVKNIKEVVNRIKEQQKIQQDSNIFNRTANFKK